MIFINVMTIAMRNALKVRRFRERHLEREREKDRKWRRQNPEKVQARNRAYYKANPEKAHAGVREWKKANPERAREISLTAGRKWRQANLEKERARGREWSKAHPETNRVKSHNRRARKLGNGGSFTAEEFQTLKRQYGYRCVGCWKTEAELKLLSCKLVPDHIIPISKGGMNIIENLQPLCHGTDGCNNYKGAKYLDFLIS